MKVAFLWAGHYLSFDNKIDWFNYSILWKNICANKQGALSVSINKNIKIVWALEMRKIGCEGG